MATRWLFARKKIVAIWIALLFLSYQQFQRGVNLAFPGSDLDPTSRNRNNNVILLGPHDRYNFGDLLFSNVLSKLLVSRAGYSDDEILFGGIVSTDMSAHGGSSSVLSMKKIQKLSQTDNVNGPYDIIYTGGESMSCDSARARRMMPNQELADEAKKESISRCAYLVPKRLLLSKEQENRGPLNYAVANSLGGGGSYADYCKEAMETVDYRAYRDADPLYPDSAVMTKELFSNEINQGAKEVLKNLGSGTKYIAVQHRKIKDEDPKAIAAALDAVSRGSNATIVFFAAGTVPGHDSYESYAEVKSFMKEKAVVYETENTWKAIGLISQAEAVISTSLHVRIMAFIYFKPRVTWSLGKRKLRLFIQYWDTATSAPVMDFGKVSETWDIMKKHYFDNPEASLQLNKVKYKEAVKKYLESFDNISHLLRPQLSAMPTPSE